MILCAGAGYAVQHFEVLAEGLLVGLLAGVLLAPVIPGPRSCGLRRPPGGEPSDS